MANLIRWVQQEIGEEWDRVRVYRSATQLGTFVQVAEVDISNTFYWDEASTESMWYKISFYDSVNDFESALTDSFTTTSAPIVSPKEIRYFMGLADTQPPDDTRLTSLILDASVELNQDNSGNMTLNERRLALKTLAGAYIAAWRGQQLISNGNVNFAIDGVSIQKPYALWLQRAKELRDQYNAWMYRFIDISGESTMPILDQGYSDYSDFLVQIMHGQPQAKLSMPDMKTKNDNEAPIIPSP